MSSLNLLFVQISTLLPMGRKTGWRRSIPEPKWPMCQWLAGQDRGWLGAIDGQWDWELAQNDQSKPEGSVQVDYQKQNVNAECVSLIQRDRIEAHSLPWGGRKNKEDEPVRMMLPHMQMSTSSTFAGRGSSLQISNQDARTRARS
jgi:hypothetical protein